MAGFLSTLLSAKEPVFSYAIKQLEKSAGNSGIDIRLIADIRQQAFEVMRRLRLDPADTTAEELYSALRSNARDKTLFSNTDFVGLIVDRKVVSFNQDDIQENVERPFSKRTKKHLVCSIEYELVSRYDAHARTDSRVVQRFAEGAGLAVCKLDEYHAKKQSSAAEVKKEKK